MINYEDKKVKLITSLNGVRMIEIDYFGSWTKNAEGIKKFHSHRHGHTLSDIILIKNYLEDFDNVWNAYMSGDEIVHVGGVSNRWHE